MPPRMVPHDTLRVAVAARVSLDSVQSYLAGNRMQPSIRDRIEGALRELSLEKWLRPAEPEEPPEAA